MDRGVAARLGTLAAALALSACMMPYDGLYEAPPAPAWSAIESPDSYAFIDRADSLWEAIGDAPPDHAFTFDDAEPWAWDLADGHRIVVEETGDGIRSFYFAPGEDGPFLAVRPGMSFGFEGETVAVVYGPDGGAMPRDAGSEHLGEGAELYARGRLLLRAMLQKQWRAVDSQAWIDTGPMIWGSVALWDNGMTRHPGWGRHRETVRNADWRHRLTAERLRRQALAEQFRRWREGGFQGSPPGNWHKPGDRPGFGGPGRPRPGIDRPRQPGQGGRPPGAQPGPPRGPDETPGRPRPGWQPGRPSGPDAGGPGRPRPGGWQDGRPRPPATAPVPMTETPGTAPAPAVSPPRRPGWGWRPRPDRGTDPTTPGVPPASSRPSGGSRPWSRPRPDAVPGAPATVPRPRPAEGAPRWSRQGPDAGVGAPPATRPPRGNGGWTRPERSAPPPAPSTAPPPRPSPAPSSKGATLRNDPEPQ
ncbi:hypothetical protein RZN05_00380 [Sphingomonas sp. HF-S4]|uniref:Uncharacterized protein n=1 Tax=Sphingomonas agrestis TaxID=3080540 RepID=A0ABU3Y224_9SPHN|nr:hypothetical protein [Sphingomonas sp. HF-S4]MDV3455421.1 hypothetical protein [Sphingomonas sp. HF-S4]